jgi:hypothetical protein
MGRFTAISILAALLAFVPCLADEDPPPPVDLPAAGPDVVTSPVNPAREPIDRGRRRLFQRFVEDAAIVPGGWIEGQYSFENLPDENRHFAGARIAFKVVRDLEAGMRLGYELINPDHGSRASGASDIDLYAKYRFPGSRGRFAAGALFKAPVADEGKMLGTGKSDLEIFGAYRADLEAVTLVANAGFRLNGDPSPPLQPARNSYLAGGAVLLPATPSVTFVVEGTLETTRVAGGSDDARLTVGLEVLGHGGKGGFRAAVGLPLSDGAPDGQLLVGAFFTY